MLLGPNIKARRQSLGWSLETLAQKSGVSRAMLSDIEREVKNPTISIVCQIAEGLGCKVSELIGEENSEVQGFQVLRQEQMSRLIDPVSGVERVLLDKEMLRRGLEVIAYFIPAGQKTGTFPAHQKGVVEHISVIEGSLTCRLNKQPPLVLEAGDSLFFQADQPHEFYNEGSKDCRYLLLIDSRFASY